MSQLAFSLDAPRTTAERWAVFHARHPWVLGWLIDRLDEARGAGMKRIGIRALWEQLRWHVYVERREGEQYKLNDHYPPHYAREIQRRRPDLAAMFETRELRAS